MFSSLFSKLSKNAVLQHKLLPILLISVVIIVMFSTMGDLGQLIKQTTGQGKSVDLGVVRNCNPAVALCSLSTTLNGKKIRLSMSIDEAVTEDKYFPINLLISGLKSSEIKSVSVNLELSGVEVQENKHYLQKKTNNATHLKSRWQNKIKIPQVVKDRKDWLATIVISLGKQSLQISYQLHLNSSH